MYEFLYQLSKSKLNSLYNCTTDEKLKESIRKVVSNKKDIDSNYAKFLSERTTHESDELLDRYDDISTRLNINSLDFLINLAYQEKGNNIGASCSYRYLDTPSMLYANENIRKLLAGYNINNLLSFSRLFFFHKYPDESKNNEIYNEIMESKDIAEEIEKLRYFSYFDNFFKNEEMIRKYESVFNTYMYIREYIFSQLKGNKTFTKDNIFDDIDEKTQIIIDNFKDICSYLLSVREAIDGLRLSFGNTKIAYNSKKEDKEFTEYQRTFINGLAFGTTKEKLENGDYTDLSRIIYLPKNKVYQLSHK